MMPGSWNAELPIFVTLFGIVKLVALLYPLHLIKFPFRICKSLIFFLRHILHLVSRSVVLPRLRLQLIRQLFSKDRQITDLMMPEFLLEQSMDQAVALFLPCQDTL